MPDGADCLDDAVIVVLRAQEEAGLEPLTDGRLGDPGFEALIAGRENAPDVVAAWRFAAGRTARAVKHALPGPYSIGWRVAGGQPERAERTRRAAERLRGIIGELAAAGCPLVEIEETEAHRIGADDVERALFREAHERLIDGIDGTHLSLSIVGAAADAAGIETIMAAPYASLAVDLIAGPDNWKLVADTPIDRGIVVGALSAGTPSQSKEVLVWGAHYAASTAGRGLERVGLGSAGSWAGLEWAEAARRMRALGEAARIAALPPGQEFRRSLDPRALSPRRAGRRHVPPNRRAR